VNRDGHPDEATAIYQAASAAMARSGVSAEDLGHVNACASGHPRRDRYEAEGLRRVLGSHADSVPVTAIKSYTGSAGSGSALCEVAASLLALQHGVVPKTLNFSTPDSESPLNVIHGEHLTTSNGLFLKTSVTRMGQASAVVVKV
jgi:3-oxoacyl-(acyl-carrier-protein) synthase